MELIDPQDNGMLANLKALVIDDNMHQRLLLNQMLEKLRFDVELAENGEDGIAKFNKRRPDIIFMEVEMPIMGGIETARIIREILREEFLPILFIIDNSSEKHLDNCISVGGDDFIKKPISLASLSARSSSLLRLKQLHNEQILQKREIEGFKAEADLEHETAAMLYEKIVNSGYMESPNVRHIMTPMALFNGDILLCAYTPANKLHILLGDFNGHGITSAFAAAPTAEIFNSMTSKGFGLREITDEINTKLVKLLPTNMFLAMTLVCLDNENHNLSTITCGLPDHFLFNKATGDIKVLLSKNLPLGIVSSLDLSITEDHIEVTSDHHLFMFTDGVIETKNTDGIPFNFAGIKKCLSPKVASSFDLILKSLAEHQGSQNQQDDITLVQLTCDFESAKWNDHNNLNPQVTIEPSNWEVSTMIDYKTLRRLNPVPTMVNSLIDIQGLQPFRASIFLVVTELFVNSLDHGLLGLNSTLKSTPDGFAAFFDLKQERLDNLTTGYIKLTFIHRPYRGGGELVIRVQDTGNGFDKNEVASSISNNEQYSGRGIQLIRQICDSLEYSNGGRQATAIFSWKNNHPQ